MAIAAGTTANFTWRSDGVTVAVTPNGGSTTTFSTSLDKVANVLTKMLADDQRGAASVTSIKSAISASSTTRGGNTHCDL